MLRLLLLLLILPLLPATSARADVTIVVDTSADVTGFDGYCSLREAIPAANNNNRSFECSGLGGGYDRIEFALGPGTPNIDIASNLPAITGPVEIDGGPNRVELRGTGTSLGLTLSGAGAANSVGASASSSRPLRSAARAGSPRAGPAPGTATSSRPTGPAST
jgi:CSLREA domain-containing protein